MKKWNKPELAVVEIKETSWNNGGNGSDRKECPEGFNGGWCYNQGNNCNGCKFKKNEEERFS